MKLSNDVDVLTLMERTLNFIDTRLSYHGRRVAYIVYQLLWPTGRYTPEEMRDICIAALLHDVGAYKTEEIDRMVNFNVFETEDTREHAVYGYLFLKHFSPIPHLAPVILYHHSGCGNLPWGEEAAWLAQVFFLADRLDILTLSGVEDKEELLRRIEQQRGKLFYSEVVDLLLQSGVKLPVKDADVADGSEIHRMLNAIPLQDGDAEKFLRMIVLFIDLRSHHTMTHTIATTAISEKLAGLFGLEGKEKENLVTGSWLHDIGKTGIPLRILEKPTALSHGEMEKVRQHVSITGAILDGCVPDEIRKIAAHHHEKLDGSGYPDGLAAGELSRGERIAVVADIFSALCGTRSYKTSFPKEKVMSIMTEMRDAGLLDAQVVDTCVAHYDEIEAHMEERVKPYEESFKLISAEFEELKALLAGEAEG